MFRGMPVERITITLPAGFDPARHGKALEKLIADKHGEGFEVDHIDPVGLTATATRQAVITEVVANNGKDRTSTPSSFTVNLPRGTKPSDGEKMATKFEDQYPGAYLTKFEPFLGKAVITRLTDAEARCRGAVAVALGVKPWEVQVKARRGGRFDLELPKTYVPSKHDSKLEEVATGIVGREGWYVETNPAKLTASIIPSDPPTFPSAYPCPLDRIREGDIQQTKFGRFLPKPGQETVLEV
jgi:hypothetical protein